MNANTVMKLMAYSKYSIEDMQKLAESKGGKCLSKKYVNNETKLKWQCKEGHIWETTPSKIINSGRWCHICAGNLPLTIEEMHEIARERRGLCLSEATTTVAAISTVRLESIRGGRLTQ